MNTSIRFSSDILKRLGEELNPSPDRGILELVKNSYDADATECSIEMQDSTLPGGTIIIRDNGTGMESDDIINGWLVLGSSIKNSNKKTKLGRLPSGSKGLGRLAALRLGSRTSLRTVPKDNNKSVYSIQIDWSKYDNASLVEDVSLVVRHRKSLTELVPGTEIHIENLHNRLTRMDVNRLAKELILLADPFGDDSSGFKPTLIAPEFSDLEKLVQNRYFRDADFHLHANLDHSGFAKASLQDWKGDVLYSADHNLLAMKRGKEPYKCPKCTFDLWVFLLNHSNFSLRQSTLGEVRTWLQEFGGVYIYQNGLRVLPYGNQGNDWLDLNLKRARSPEERPSTNNSIGRLSLLDYNGMLIQKTDRGGFIETNTFEEARAFATDSLEWMAARRMELALKRRESEKKESLKATKQSKRVLERAVSKLPKQIRDEMESVLETFERSQQKEITQLNKEVQLYRTLSTAGITAATFAHESSGNPIKVIDQCITTIERRARKKLGLAYNDLLDIPVRAIQRSTGSLAVLGKATLQLLNHEKRRSGRVDIHSVIRNVDETYKPFLEERDVVRPILNLCNGNPFLKGTEAAVESIVTNLINNAVAAFEDAGTQNRKIIISTCLEDTHIVLSINDSGPGIQGISIKDIWLPGQTTRKNGTGLGLTIVRDAVRDLGGEVNAEESGPLGGALFEIKLPIIGA